LVIMCRIERHDVGDTPSSDRDNIIALL
jgi:hypothetical protein